ncbi:hypothetical protein NPS33_21235 [Pseudomonas putida]|uniref:hypothetical protein n=1 Tax=Pseudomonas putida TaxID=303 RepID=UPI002363E37D|nr:hypothetical protein [Pseudomonas putida]MDD2017404.1 hypothetical protein [Pseudomonas putida]
MAILPIRQNSSYVSNAVTTADQFNLKRERCYILTVGDYSNGKGIKIDSRDYQRPLQITFNVDKSSDNKHNTGNSASIEIYNLSPDQEQMLESRFLEAELHVGYSNGEGLKLLAKGNLTECSTFKRGTDTITQMIIGEGYVHLTQARLSQNLSPGQTVKDVIDTIVDNMPGVARGPIVGTNLNSHIIHGWRLSGTPKEELDKLTKAYNLEYNITNDTITVTDFNGPVSKSTMNVPVISEETGMIDQPFRITEKSRVSGKDKRARAGVQVKVLLDAGLTPSRVIKIEYKDYTGFYRISSIRFTGDFRGNEWYAELQCNDMQDSDITIIG